MLNFYSVNFTKQFLHVFLKKITGPVNADLGEVGVDHITFYVFQTPGTYTVTNKLENGTNEQQTVVVQ